MQDQPAPIMIRQARPGDLETIVAFNQRMALETESVELDIPTLRQGVARVLEDQRLGRYLIAQIGEETAGQLMHTYEWSDWRCGMFWWLQSVFVRPRYRRAGVFAQLYGYLSDQAREDPDVCGLRLYVENSNRVAQQSYARMAMKDAEYQVWEALITRPKVQG